MNILIVEDHKETLDVLTSSLKAEGFVVDAAEDGQVGLQKAMANDYDIAVLDIGLPHKDGKQITRELRAAGKTLPILILSVKTEIATKADLLDIGADDYLIKPFSFVELVARIRALLRRPQTMEAEIMEVGDVVVDIRKRKVARGTREIHLTPKEFYLFEYLLRHRGEVLSRQALLEHVWDVNADPFTNTVETHIMTLRKKIGDDKRKRKLIASISGAGYTISS